MFYILNRESVVTESPMTFHTPPPPRILIATVFIQYGASLSFRSELHGECDKPYRCDVCSSNYKTKASLYKHTLYIHAEKKYPCDDCDQAFAKEWILNQHKREKHFQTYKCQLCDSGFRLLTLLEKHLKAKHGPVLFKCDVANCGKTFGLKGNFKQHIATHSGLKLHHCNLCGKSFTKKGNMKNHLYIHSGLRQFECEICGKHFVQPYTLITHRMRHTDEYKATLVRPQRGVR